VIRGIRSSVNRGIGRTPGSLKTQLGIIDFLMKEANTFFTSELKEYFRMVFFLNSIKDQPPARLASLKVFNHERRSYPNSKISHDPIRHDLDP
jgi:hypothetical protein